YGIDYRLDDGIQHQGLRVQIEPSFVSYSGVFASNVWINMTCNWYGSDGALIKTDILYMFYHGSVSNKPDPGRFDMWLDFWFDSTNGSQTIGGRINAYEFPVEDESDAWLRWLSSNWGVKDNVQKQSEAFTKIVDRQNTTAISSERINFVNLFHSLDVYGVTDGDQFVGITDYTTYAVTHSTQLPMSGISSPPWDETQMPTVGNAGVLGAIYAMFAGMAAFLSENVMFGGLNLWGSFVNFLDTIAAWLGAPGFFTWMFGQVGNALAYLYDAAAYGFDVVAQLFSMITALLGSFLGVMGELIASLGNTLTIFTDMMGGAYGTGADMWNDLGISSWITVALIFYPIYLIYLWEEEGDAAVIGQLSFLFGILVFLFNFFSSIISGAIQLITGLIESIPVAE
ncbi:unnamed protein product, partial [marine sediment metagenome]